MYQVIDDQDEENVVQPAQWSILPFLIGGLLAAFVFFCVWLFSPGKQAAPGQAVETPASRAAYLVALSEPNPAVRRARLLDYKRTYPDSDRSYAIEGQLDIINTAELGEWETLYGSIYSDKLKVEEKWSVMADYEMRWNGSLLGGRGDELVDLKQVLDTAKPIDDLPDRTLDPGKSPIPENIPSDTLAGAPPQMSITHPIPAPVAPPPPAPVAPIAVPASKDVIVQPRVRKNASPSYPRSAKSKNIGAVVTISMDINEKGKVKEATVIEIQAERYQKEFIKAARRAAKRTKFHPKTVNGTAVSAKDIRKRYIFRNN